MQPKLANMFCNALTALFCMLFLASSSSISEARLVSASEMDRIVRLRFKVHIINGFANNSKPLIIRCHSNDDDLGEHTLWQNQEFRFEFKQHFVRLTHFVCNFKWDSKSLDDISVFKSGVESRTCKSTGNCFWKAQEDGIYFSNDDQNWDKKFGW